MNSTVEISDIEEAARRIDGVAIQTPLVELPLDARVPVCAKCENLQVVGAFKIRGAFNFIAQLAEEKRRHGVVTYSSGNHAQAVALAARLVGVPAVVVMPTTASRIKVEGAQALGAEVIFEGTTSADRRVRAEAEASVRSLQIVPPFDHPWIIAGQGTVGLEILRDCPDVARVFVPIGGGGLISGIAVALKQRRPDVLVIGVEPKGAAKMQASLDCGRPVSLEHVSSIADGLLPVRPGDLNFDYTRRLVDEVITVSDEAIARAVLWLFQRAKLVVEASGAATLAAVLDNEERWCRVGGGPTVVVLSGGNISLDTLVAMNDKASGYPQEPGTESEGTGRY